MDFNLGEEAYHEKKGDQDMGFKFNNVFMCT